MNVLIKSAIIIDKKSEFNSTTQDILVENGIIRKIGNSLINPGNFQEINLDNLHASPGWFDSSVCFGEPGYEDRETIKNGLDVAAFSGFSAVALNANTNPIIDTRSGVIFVKEKSKTTATKLLPIGALTVQSEGQYLAEVYDMHRAGSTAFGDYKKPISNPNTLKIGLLYVSNFNGLVQSFPQNLELSQNSVMNENITSTTLGLKGSPELAESIQVARDLEILEYTNGKLHIPTISSAKSVDLIRSAKAKGLDVSCSVAIHNLILRDSDIKNYNTHFKVNPPLRTQHSIDALLEGIKDGTIDMVTSDHNPITVENKKVEFDFADFGTIGLESAFGALNSIFSTQLTVELLTNGKTRFGIPDSSINIGNPCDITLFNPKVEHTFRNEHILSKSKNSIFIGQKLHGRVYGVLANNVMKLNL